MRINNHKELVCVVGFSDGGFVSYNNSSVNCI